MRHRLLISCLLLTGLSSAMGRERILINQGWRFHKGDPPEIDSDNLLYDIRPEEHKIDESKRRAEDTSDAEQTGPSLRPVLKPWILPSGNSFIKDPARRFTRPKGNPVENISYVENEYDDTGWDQVDLPHDWAIAGPFNTGGVGGGMGRLPSPGIGWYRKTLHIPDGDDGKSIFLDIDGAMSYAAVWVNGQLVGGWPYGYSSWRLNLTPFVCFGGDNEIAIRLDNPPDFSRWYPGAGLYRNVWLVKTSPVHVGQWGTRLTTSEVSDFQATLNLQVIVDNDSAQPAKVNVSTEIHELDTAGPLVTEMKPVQLQIFAGDHAMATSVCTLTNPRLWGPPPTQQPNRYVAVTTITRGEQIVDRYETRFGIRKIECLPDGLYVNGKRIRIQGVNQHHDLGALGAAFNERAAERQLAILREMGCNAIRMAHNPPSPELLELTDRMGFLVIDEIFDSWVRQKTPFDFHLIFPDWHEQDLRSMIRRDANHPSIFAWSVGNEVGEQYNGEQGAMVARELVSIAHDEDPTRPASASMNFAKPGSAFADAVDFISLNYQGEGIRNTPEFEGFQGIKTPPLYDAFHDKYPGRMIVSSESAAAFSSRDSYLFPVAQGISNPLRGGHGGDDHTHQVSAYELYAADFGSTADKVFAAQDRHPYVAGEFVWSGWDYLGEPTPYYSSRSSYFGIIDLAGFPKDRYYLYQSRWRPDLPMAHILPHWTWPERVGQITPIHVFTSGDEAELFLNGKSLGRKQKGPFEYRLRWDNVVYEPGRLEVVAYKNGRVWAKDAKTTAGTPTRLRMTADRQTIRNDGLDLSFITVNVTDDDGQTSPRADNDILFFIEGPGEIVATDNGDPTDMTAFATPERKAFHGQALAIVRAKPGLSGEITLKVYSTGMLPAKVILNHAP